jgi:hypothetical protein
MRNLFYNLFKEKPRKFIISELWWLGLSNDWKKLISINVNYYKGGRFQLTTYDDYIWQSLTNSDPDFAFFKENERTIAEMTAFKCFKVNDISPLSAMVHIKDLTIDLYNSDDNVLSYLQDLSVLSYLQDLEEIDISIEHSMQVNLKPIISLKKLKTVSLFLDYATIDLSPLSKLPNINRLFISDTSSKLDPLSKLKNLTFLYLSNNKNDLSPLSQLTNLQELYLLENSVSLEPLSKLSNLSSLYLTNNEADLTPINGLKNLTHLNLYPRRCKIDSITELISQIKRNRGSVFIYEDGDSPGF